MSRSTTTPTKRVTKRQLVALGAAALSAAVMAVPAQAGIGAAPADRGPLTERYGFFPEYYQDAAGVRLQLCIALAPTCGAIATPGPGPVSFPGNFPDELFYWSASVSVQGVSLTLAQEATFDGIDGNQAVFGRLRIRGTGLTPGAFYRFTTPYGIVEEQARAGNPQIRNIGSDVGCGPAIGRVCTDVTFGDVGASAIGPNFLTWDTFPADPALTTAAGRFVGDAVTPHAVTGSTFTAPGELTPANYFQVDRISGLGGTVEQTLGRETNFVVQGKLADVPPQPFLLTSPGAAGNQPIANGPKALTVKVRNGGSGDLKLATAAVTGGADFTITSSDCTNKTLVPAGRTQDPGNADQFCTVVLAFDPSTAGAKTATLRLTEQAPAGTVHDIALTGVGTQPTLSTDQAGVSFGAQQVGTTAPMQTVTVRNTGGASLLVTGASTSGDFAIVSSTCTSNTLAPNATCSIDLHFTPAATGVRNGTLDITSAAGARSVPLSGTGTAAPLTAGPAGAVIGAASGRPTTIAQTLPKLALGRFGMARRVKRSVAFRQGIRMFMELPAGTEVVKINVYQRRFGKLRLISSGFRAPARTGRVNVRLNHLTLRRLLRRIASYEVRATPGRSRSDLGTTSKASFKVVPG